MPENRFNITGKTVLITGGTRGIGLEIAKACKEEGAFVWIHGTKEKNTHAVAAQYGFQALHADLRYEDERKKLVSEICQRMDVIDILFNNAGFEKHSSIEGATEDYLDEIYAVNARSPYFLIHDLMELLKKSHDASVINVTSLHQEIPVKENSSYCMSKASLAMLTKVASLELAKWNIRVNNLAPGVIETDINRELVNSMPFQDWIPMGRTGKVEDIVGPALFLASSASQYMTGTTLYVDGGYMHNLLRY